MAAGPPVSFASPEPLAGFRTGPGGQVPGLHVGALREGRNFLGSH